CCALTLLVLFLVPGYSAAAWTFWLELHDFRYVVLGCLLTMFVIWIGRQQGWRTTRFLDSIGPHLVYRSAAVILMLVIVVPPLADLIPALTHGPILNRRHAAALRSVRTTTPEDAILWHWWDWGYAAHHFSRRKTIADGAAHGGPSLYLPSVVYATDDARFARQIIKYTALHENIPGNVFKDMTSTQAAKLIADLRNPETPLIKAPGKQYLIVSFDMLNLGFWISTFGSWDFTTKESRGYAISIVPQQLSYRLDKGEVVMKKTGVNVPAASIDVFADGQLDHRDYVTPPEYLPNNAAIKAWREDIDRRRNVHFLFNRVTGEKLVVDDRMYNTLMVQLLLCTPTDPEFAPFFRLIYDNVFCRIYEVL
ncbi:MAG: dolichyl-diphosphooligosaccharide-protein glycosyltransferase, partial [Bilophila sp.]